MKVYIGEKQSGIGGCEMWKDNLVEKRLRIRSRGGEGDSIGLVSG